LAALSFPQARSLVDNQARQQDDSRNRREMQEELTGGKFSRRLAIVTEIQYQAWKREKESQGDYADGTQIHFPRYL